MLLQIEMGVIMLNNNCTFFNGFNRENRYNISGSNKSDLLEGLLED